MCVRVVCEGHIVLIIINITFHIHYTNIDVNVPVGYMTMVGLLFCPCEPTERLVIIVVVVFVIGIAAAAAFVVASTIGSNFSVVI